MSELLANLKAMRTMIEGGWCQGHYATDDRGIEADVLGPEATCFCLDGANFRATDTPFSKRKTSPAYLAVRAEIFKVVGKSPIFFNDNTTKENVLASIDKAIANVKLATDTA